MTRGNKGWKSAKNWNVQPFTTQSLSFQFLSTFNESSQLGLSFEIQGVDCTIFQTDQKPINLTYKTNLYDLMNQTEVEINDEISV